MTGRTFLYSPAEAEAKADDAGPYARAETGRNCIGRILTVTIVAAMLAMIGAREWSVRVGPVWPWSHLQKGD